MGAVGFTTLTRQAEGRTSGVKVVTLPAAARSPG